MPAITASQVKALRDETGLPMMECKSALTEAGGDSETAKELLQKKYKGKMASRATNVTGEGRVGVYISDDKTVGAIVDLRCETAPVAKTDQYIALADGIAKSVAAQDVADLSPDAAIETPSAVNPGRTVKDEITEVFGLLRENITIQACRKMSGAFLCAYVHHDGKSGVMVALDAAPSSDDVAVDLCHHVVFTNPMAITRDQIPADKIEKVENLAREVAVAEGKPAQIVDKIVEGKVNAFCAENALMDQEHVKVSKTKVRDVLKPAGVSAVTEVSVVRIGG